MENDKINNADNSLITNYYNNLEKHPPLYDKPIEVINIRTARKLLTRAIKSYQLSEITDKQLKTFTYVLQTFIMIVKAENKEIYQEEVNIQFGKMKTPFWK